jgi:DNA-binding NarL/FixJ family response regulator
MDQKITVLLVDDHVLVRRGFRRILEDEADITVVGEASNGVEAVQMACDLRPRVVLMDYAMPRMNGLLATRRILRARPEIAVLMLSMHSEEMGVREVIEAGVRGYILKNDFGLGSGFGNQASSRR